MIYLYKNISTLKYIYFLALELIHLFYKNFTIRKNKRVKLNTLIIKMLRLLIFIASAFAVTEKAFSNSVLSNTIRNHSNQIFKEHNGVSPIQSCMNLGITCIPNFPPVDSTLTDVFPKKVEEIISTPVEKPQDKKFQEIDMNLFMLLLIM